MIIGHVSISLAVYCISIFQMNQVLWKIMFFCTGLTMQANVYYKLLISWTSQKVKDTCVTRNTFDFKHGIF